MSAQTYDAIVVGSGISGGWAAKELTERGLSVLLLERGRNIEHVKDYPNALKGPWEIPHRGRVPTSLRDKHPVLRRDYVLNETNYDFWAHENEHPYVEKKPFDWFRGYHVGGRSLTWGRQSYRWSDFDFEANAREGIAVDWPIRYNEIAPWYDHVERWAGISGSREGLAQLPDGQFLPPMPLNVAEQHVAAGIRKSFNDRRRLVIGRVANLSVPHNGRTVCQDPKQVLGRVPVRCVLQLAVLDAAGRAPHRPPHAAATLDRAARGLRQGPQARSWRGSDRRRHQTNDGYPARIVFLCASAFNSTWILMNSATDVWPDGLGSSSGELGHNAMDHHFRVGATGRIDGFTDRIVNGRRPTGFYIPRFRNVFEDKRQYVRGFGYQGSASRMNWAREVAELGIGAALKEELREPGPWTIGMTGFGEILPYHDNRITLDRGVTDAWGLPVLAMDCEIKQNEQQMRLDMMNDAAEMLDAAGVRNVQTTNTGYNFGRGIHEMGTARMGRDPKTSALNGNNQVWDAPNVFVTDGACMTSASCVNPSLTYMALTARAAAFAVDELKKQNL